MSDIFYTKDHEWIKSQSGGVYKLGVTHYAVEQLGDIVHLELPETGSTFTAGDAFGTIESTKTVSDLYTPFSGSVVAVNESYLEEPEKLQASKTGEAWLVEIKAEDKPDDLLTEAEYKKFITED